MNKLKKNMKKRKEKNSFFSVNKSNDLLPIHNLVTLDFGTRYNISGKIRKEKDETYSIHAFPGSLP